MDTAIWTNPCGDFAGQLLYGDLMQWSNLVSTLTVTSLERSDCSGRGDVHFAIVLPNRATLPAIREARLQTGGIWNPPAR